uniref:Uncharacterized protein n=1 Tax=Hyaloperonospora arabidopsidis (strain Emoy2) TaxID=559515 RepID=M4B2Y9_HYAAE
MLLATRLTEVQHINTTSAITVQQLANTLTLYHLRPPTHTSLIINASTHATYKANRQHRIKTHHKNRRQNDKYRYEPFASTTSLVLTVVTSPVPFLASHYIKRKSTEYRCTNERHMITLRNDHQLLHHRYRILVTKTHCRQTRTPQPHPNMAQATKLHHLLLHLVIHGAPHHR